MLNWTRKYWEIGHSFYRKYPPTLFGQARAMVMYLLLPRCHKIIAPDPTNHCIHVATFSEAEKVEKMLKDMGVQFE